MKNAERRKQEFEEKVAKDAEKKEKKKEEKKKQKTRDEGGGEDESAMAADDAEVMKRVKMETAELDNIKQGKKRQQEEQGGRDVEGP